MDVRFMKRALKVAARYEGRTSPNPPVGAVIVKDGIVVSEGLHEGPGLPHAEVNALVSCTAPVGGADLYVTLEPCSHHGRTPPCTDSLIGSGIKRVFIGMRDPNPNVKGCGADVLKASGIEVVTGVLGDRVEKFYEAYSKFVIKNLPFVTLKAALTLDGKLATSTGDSQWISSEKSRQLVHHLRSVSDAVMVGIGTVCKDDPLLNVRMVKGRDPMRVVVDPDLLMAPEAKMLHEGTGKVIIAAAGDADKKQAARLQECGAEIIFFDRDESGLLQIEPLMKELARRNVMRLLVEGGANIFTYLIKHAIFDKLLLVYAPKILTGNDSLGLTVGKGPEKMAEAIHLRGMTTRRIGGDFLVEAYPGDGKRPADI